MYEKASTLDRFFRSLLLSKFFTKGWGNPATIKRQFDFLRVLGDRSSCQNLVNEHYPVNIDSDVEKGDVRILDGHFRSPFDRYLPNVMPKEVKTARFQLIVPVKWPTHRKPVCIHMAGTGDHFFWRRRTILARPLIKEYGIGSLLIENPFYGYRKPKDQLRSSLQHVNDLFVMGGGLILEGLVMLHWCEKQGFGPLGLTGMSMGGHMASLTATNWHKPIPLIPCLSWSSATPSFTEGVLSGSIPWPVLVTQYMGQHVEYEKEIMRKLQRCPKTDAFTLGQEFVWNYPESLDDLKEDCKKHGDERCPSNPSPNAPEASLETSKAETKASSPNQIFSGSGSSSITSDGNDVAITSKGGMPNLDSHPAVSDSCGNHGGREEKEKSAIEFWPAGKLDLQEAVVKSFDGSDLVVGGISRNEKIANADAESTSSKTFEQTDSKSRADEKSSPYGDDRAIKSTSPRERSNMDALKDVSSVQQDDKDSASRKKTWRDLNRKSVKGIENYQDLKKEALEFMRGVMDVTTFVGNFSTPVDTSLVIIVSALRDGYIPRRGVPGLDEIWPGVEVRYIDGGHISAFLFKQTEFRKAIGDSFNKYLAKYDNGKEKHQEADSNSEVKS